MFGKGIYIRDIKTIDEISKSIEINSMKIIEYLAILELEGIIKSVSGGRYMLAKIDS